MFESKNNRFVTRGIAEEVPITTQVFLWSLIDDQVSCGNQLGYFQKFALKATEKGQKILHSQEEPEWSQVVFLQLAGLIQLNKTIWLIDSGEYQTMLFPEDY